MTDDSYWSAVVSMRQRVADLLESLRPEEWDAGSLCSEWRVRDVAGHLSCVPTITTWELLRSGPRGRFDMNRMNTVIAKGYGDHEPAWIVARIREHAGARRTAKVLDTRNSLFDVIVHSQDIAVPLGRTFDVPPELAADGLARVWEMGMPFHARKRFAGLTLRATDADIAVGAGPEVRGPALSLLLLATGRAEVAAPALSGAGVDALPR
ncbi:uncharacterized protein (TIGR03083 family) [Nocardioides thalensis]|uniref:Uncharacterized protein (TIGR03083 family) n=1 Tax=Nocardioides thalensis TaxID=1914755 RepID=A0A853C014_9ACTN|nr:maleylpyruvate isomerase family mycothiol-dependent enzyme [Nocardioides thalensis]NYJ00845.1 uncharacterized protein (TIGR03083 family) [Nocardioides thalensis]